MNSRKDAGAQAKPPPVTSAWLERVALYYLDRYSASTEMLRRMLIRRIDKRCRARGEDPHAFASLLEETVERALRAGLVDDTRFTLARLATLRRRGTSTRGVGAKLAAKGVAREVVEAALAAEADDMPRNAEVEAAKAYAKRRRLGSHRAADKRDAFRERDLAAMARAGFGYGLARAILDGSDPEG